jgi:dephospho-CoA kinase
MNVSLKVGLTGGIATGKTAVSDLFAQLNVPSVDADVISHQLVAKGQPALAEIVETFGAEMLQSDGHLNRAALRQRVFTDAIEREKLEAILHPKVYAEIFRQVNQLDAPYCIISVPLLLETQQQHQVDRIAVVDCPIELQYQRLAKRSGLSTAAIEQILQAQLNRETRLSYADDVINNSKNINELARQVHKLHEFYLSLV